jgi:hypothetical protein
VDQRRPHPYDRRISSFRPAIEDVDGDVERSVTVPPSARDAKSTGRVALVVEPSTRHRVPSKKYIDALEDLGADDETLEVARGKRSARLGVLEFFLVH